MRLAEIVEVSGRVGKTAKRLEKINLLVGLLGRLTSAEIPVAAPWLSGFVRQGRLGIGWATLRDAKAEPAGAPSLELADVDQTLARIAEARGAGSGRLKIDLLRGLFVRATADEQRFLSGLLMGELRQGALEAVMVEAVARATGLPVAGVRRAVMLSGDASAVVEAVLTEGAGGLNRFVIQLFRPLQPMLASPADDVEQALDDLGEAALEWKLDGARVQVHKFGDEVHVYSRRLNDVSAAVPEVVEVVRNLPPRELILDGEAIAMTPDGRPHPFQVTMRRFGRKLDVEQMRASLPLSAFWFDLLYLDGGELIDEPQSRRFAELAGFAPAEAVMPHTRTADPTTAQAFLDSALERGHEGIMGKAADAPYEAGSRGRSWLKIKQAHTLDLVVLAAEWGHGRRRGWLSNLHLGARDERGGFVMLGKTFKGLTDQMLAWQTEELLKLEVAHDEYTVHVEPKLVVEIAFNELQASPRYPGGLALRFARVKRYRPDKSANAADTFESVKKLAAPPKTSS